MKKFNLMMAIVMFILFGVAVFGRVTISQITAKIFILAVGFAFLGDSVD